MGRQRRHHTSILVRVRTAVLSQRRDRISACTGNEPRVSRLAKHIGGGEEQGCRREFGEHLEFAVARAVAWRLDRLASQRGATHLCHCLCEPCTGIKRHNPSTFVTAFSPRFSRLLAPLEQQECALKTRVTRRRRMPVLAVAPPARRVAERSCMTELSSTRAVVFFMRAQLQRILQSMMRLSSSGPGACGRMPSC
jgi:hypothetical protein